MKAPPGPECRTRVTRLDGLAVLVLLGVVLALALPRWKEGLDLLDEGHLAFGAVRVLDGELPQRDFESLQPPLSFWGAALAFELFGTTLATLRGLGLALHGAIALLVYAVAREVAGRTAALGAGLLAAAVGMPFFLFVPYAAWLAVAFGALAVGLLLRSSGATRPAWAVGAGVAAGLAALSRQDLGAYLVLTAMLHAFVQRLQPSLEGPRTAVRLARIGLGLGAVLVPSSIFWLASGAADEVLRQLVLFPLTTYAHTSSLPWPVFTPSQSAGERVLVALFYLPPLVHAASAVVLGLRLARGRFRARDGRVATVLAWSALSSLQVLARSDVHHLLITLPPFFVLLAAWGDEMIGAAGRPVARWSGRAPDGSFVRALTSAGAALAAVLVAWAAAPSLGARGRATRDSFVHRPPLELASLLPTYAAPGVPLSLARAGVRLQPGDAAFLAELVRFVHEHARADQAILCLPYQPMLYFLAERRNPTRWNYLWPGDQSAADHRRLVSEARLDPPAVVLLTEAEKLAANAPEIVAYVEQDFRRVGNLGPISLYVPRVP